MGSEEESQSDSTRGEISVPPVLRFLQPSEAPLASRVLARAFYGDPIQSAMFPDPESRAEALPLVFESLILATAAYGGHMMTTEDGSAVALWAPPGRDLTVRALLRGWNLRTLEMMKHLSISSIPAVFSVARLPRRRKAHMREPHWYLAVLGVDPSSQGRGLGTLLVREGLARADADGVGTYLETETDANVRFYERFGFEVVEQLDLRGLDLPVWLMARRPGHDGAA